MWRKRASNADQRNERERERERSYRTLLSSNHEFPEYSARPPTLTGNEERERKSEREKEKVRARRMGVA